jgi:hypothetical protein
MNCRSRSTQRGIAYQPRVQPWEYDARFKCVLKERRIDRVERITQRIVPRYPS